MDPRVVIVSCASEDYQGYIPLWGYCLEKSYPEYKAIVFLTDPAHPFLKDAVADLPNLRVVEGEFDGYPYHPPRWGAWTRYLLFTPGRYRYFVKFDWIYITDIDMMIVREIPRLHEQHIQHMKTIRLPYSNMLRDPSRFADKHMTGLHFCGQDFIIQVQEWVERYDRKIRECGECVLDGKSVIHDERLLYQIIRDAGLSLPPFLMDSDAEAENAANYQNADFRPWHGLNIGRTIGTNFDPGRFTRPRLLWWRDTIEKFIELSEDPEFWIKHKFLSQKARDGLRIQARISGFPQFGEVET